MTPDTLFVFKVYTGLVDETFKIRCGRCKVQSHRTTWFPAVRPPRHLHFSNPPPSTLTQVDKSITGNENATKVAFSAHGNDVFRQLRDLNFSRVPAVLHGLLREVGKEVAGSQTSERTSGRGCAVPRPTNSRRPFDPCSPPLAQCRS